MAINTAKKRRSVSSLWTGFYPSSVTPNVLKDVQWRQQSGWGYSGILPNGYVPPVDDISEYIVTFRRRRR